MISLVIHHIMGYLQTMTWNVNKLSQLVQATVACPQSCKILMVVALNFVVIGYRDIVN